MDPNPKIGQQTDHANKVVGVHGKKWIVTQNKFDGILRAHWVNRNKYKPHQGKQEAKRRRERGW